MGVRRVVIDVVTLRAKYAEEREKRLRPDGNDQYVPLDGAFEHFSRDPIADPSFHRDPLTDDVDVVVVGGGFSGLLAAARIRQAGASTVRVIEGGGDFGGTWYWNRYPGVQCDIESYIYLPLLEEIGYIPREKYSYGPEIWAHTQAIGRHFDLYRDACFQTEVTELSWDDPSGRWVVSTNRGDRMTARFVVMAIGALNKPKLPGIPGIDTFRGHCFHTSRWDYGYTGGDTNGNLTGLSDKRVAIIGTGATAVQCVPHLGRWAEHLHVFQRTPSSVDVRGNRPTDAKWVASLEPGWQQKRIDNFGIIVTGGAQEEDLVHDGWTDILRNLSGMADRSGSGLSAAEIAAQVELADFAKMAQIRRRVDEIVHDPATAAALKPWYRQFCKRPCFHDDYLQTFNRPNVTLVDTGGKGVERITERGIVANGEEYGVDCIIFATGFEVGTGYTRRAGCEIRGRDGVTLTDKWDQKIATYQGVMSRGFPNLLFMGGIQSGSSPNFTELYNEQSQHLGYLVGQTLAAGARTIEPSARAEGEWLQAITATEEGRIAFQSQCTPGYYNNEGRPGEGPGWFGGNYGGGSQAYFRLLREWRAAGALEGFDLR
jgi:cyclohexanone monooxygenase